MAKEEDFPLRSKGVIATVPEKVRRMPEEVDWP